MLTLSPFLEWLLLSTGIRTLSAEHIVVCLLHMTGIVVGQVGCLSRHVRDERHGTRAHLASLPSAGQEEPKKTILHVSGALGVITLDIGGPLFTSYSISKAAPNMLVYKQAKEHPDIPTVAIEPGWLKTSEHSVLFSILRSKSDDSHLQVWVARMRRSKFQSVSRGSSRLSRHSQRRARASSSTTRGNGFNGRFFTC